MTPTRPRRSHCLTALLCAALALCSGAATAARCIDEDRLPPPDAAASAPAPSVPVDARTQLQTLVRDALRQSDAVGAANLLAQAAEGDTAAARAAAQPQLSLSSTLGPSGSNYEDSATSSGFQSRTTVSFSALIYDGGRTRELTDWRSQLAKAAEQNGVSTREQIALQAVSLAIERSRFRLQTQIYRQYDRQMSCLVQALEEIVEADRGRNSELVQARKNEQQAALLVVQSASTLRQVEIRMQRLIGSRLPTGDGMGALLLTPPPLQQIVAEAENASDIASLALQADAQESLARSVAAEQKPQLSWVVSGAKAIGSGRSASWTAGVSLNVPLLNPGAQPSLDAARERAGAARLQLADALENRRYKMAEVHEQALNAFERARRGSEVVRDSDQLRNATLQQWQQLGRRSLFDVMSAESEHYALRVAYINALHDGQQSTALLRSLGRGITAWLQ